jgi:cytochrome c6
MLGLTLAIVYFIGFLQLVLGWKNVIGNLKLKVTELSIEKCCPFGSDAKMVFALASVSSIVLGGPDVSLARTGAENFQASCAGCHAGGGNSFPFSRGKTLFEDDLKKNGVTSVEVMQSLILKGKGGMPAYGEFVSSKGNTIPARYTDAEAAEISEFVLDQAQRDWK